MGRGCVPMVLQACRPTGLGRTLPTKLSSWPAECRQQCSLPAASCRDTRVALAAWPWQTYADGAALRCSALSSGATMSIGRGKTMVEFLSAAITVRVSR